MNEYTNDWERNGYWETYYSNGKLEGKGWYKNGLKVGYWEEYLSTGALWYIGSYDDNGNPVGYWDIVTQVLFYLD